MEKTLKIIPVKDGAVTREAQTGRFKSVSSSSGVFKERPKSTHSVAEASTRRSAALKRLADR